MNDSLRCWTLLTLALASTLALAQNDLLPRQSVRDFRLAHPCPMTGATRDACPGWRIDLVVPLCAGGTADAANMQWLTTQAADRKEEAERWNCPYPNKP